MVTQATANFDAARRALRRRLADGLPGPRAMRAMAVSDRAFVPVDRARAAGCREAAALVLVFARTNVACTVVTLRSGSLLHHSGQISLPGGSMEPGEDDVACARREAGEELGIALADLEVLGRLTAIYVPPSGFCISPVVGWLAQQPAWRPSATEVAQVIEVPIAHLDRAHRRVETSEGGGQVRRIPYYEIGEHHIWGATAMILCELSAVWRQCLGGEGPAFGLPAGEASCAG
jgi:8-oxo-dGTP pyrophosphatase MutT (NUDIX family)